MKNEMSKKLITINNLKEFIEARGFGEESFKDVERNTYKYTNCGAWIREDVEVEGEDYVDFLGCEHEAEVLWKGITVGSIVEGVDYDCTPETVTYPFKMDAFWSALKKVEDEANEIWKATHGCEKCWSDTQADEWGNEREFGAWPINPDCKTCKGEGAVI